MRRLESEARFDAPPDEVWAVLTDFAAYPAWNPFLPRMDTQPISGRPFTATSRLPAGIKLRFVGRIDEVEPPTRLVWSGRPAFMPPAAMNITHTFTLTPDGERATRLHQVEEVRGFLVPVSGWILGQAQQGQVAMNEALATRLAAGPS